MRRFVIKTYFDLFNIVLENFPIFYCIYNMHRGSSIELNALGESWRCMKCQKNRLLHVWVITEDSWL